MMLGFAIAIVCVGAEPLPAPATSSPTTERASAQVPERTPTQLRAAVHQALKAEATSTGPAHIAAVQELIVLHQQIGQAPMGQIARQQLQGLVGNRLRRAGARVPQNDDHGQELLELIEKTIAPTTWESQGGNGRIYYWRPGRAMVISQTADTHAALADLIEQLHE